MNDIALCDCEGTNKRSKRKDGKTKGRKNRFLHLVFSLIACLPTVSRGSKEERWFKPRLLTNGTGDDKEDDREDGREDDKEDG